MGVMVFCALMMALSWTMIKLIRHAPAIILTALLLYALHLIF